MEPIEMSRECYIACFVEDTPQEILDVTRSGHVDGQAGIQSAMHMHSMRQAEIDAKDAAIAELVEALQLFVDRVDGGEIRSKVTYAMFKGLIAKHRPDAFANPVGRVSEAYERAGDQEATPEGLKGEII